MFYMLMCITNKDIFKLFNNIYIILKKFKILIKF